MDESRRKWLIISVIMMVCILIFFGKANPFLAVLTGAFIIFATLFVVSSYKAIIYGIRILYWKLLYKKGIAIINKPCGSKIKKNKITHNYSTTVEVGGEKIENVIYKETELIDEALEYEEGMQLEIYWDEKKRKIYNYSLALFEFKDKSLFVIIGIGVFIVLLLLMIILIF